MTTKIEHETESGSKIVVEKKNGVWAPLTEEEKKKRTEDKPVLESLNEAVTDQQKQDVFRLLAKMRSCTQVSKNRWNKKNTEWSDMNERMTIENPDVKISDDMIEFDGDGTSFSVDFADIENCGMYLYKDTICGIDEAGNEVKSGSAHMTLYPDNSDIVDKYWFNFTVVLEN